MDLRILALETSGRSGTVAALNGAEPLVEVELNPKQRSAQSLAPAMAQVLAAAGWQPRDVQLVAVTSGPGSFTGLRVGVTTAKTFAWATGASVLGVDTLEAIAWQAPAGDSPIAAALEAQRDELFAAVYGSEPGKVLQPTAIVPTQAWLGSLEPGWRVSGPAVARLLQRLPPGVSMVDQSLWQPRATCVGRVAAWRYERGERDDVWKLAPRYFRPSAAEEKWAAAQQQVQSSDVARPT